MLPKAKIGRSTSVSWKVNFMRLTGFTGVVGSVLTGLFLLGAKCDDKDPGPMTVDRAKVESARLTQSPVGECWGSSEYFQCFSRNGVWTSCGVNGCEVMRYWDERPYLKKE